MDEDQAPDKPVTRPGSFADTGPGEGGGCWTGCGALLVTAAIVVLVLGLLTWNFMVPPGEEDLGLLGPPLFFAALLAVIGILFITHPRGSRR